MPDNDPTSFQTEKSEKVEHIAHNMQTMPRISHAKSKAISMQLSPVLSSFQGPASIFGKMGTNSPEKLDCSAHHQKGLVRSVV